MNSALGTITPPPRIVKRIERLAIIACQMDELMDYGNNTPVRPGMVARVSDLARYSDVMRDEVMRWADKHSVTPATIDAEVFSKKQDFERTRYATSLTPEYELMRMNRSTFVLLSTSGLHVQ